MADPVAPNCLAPGLFHSLALNIESGETVGLAYAEGHVLVRIKLAVEHRECSKHP